MATWSLQGKGNNYKRRAVLWIWVLGSEIVLIGKEELGTLYAVYSLLETFGVRWFNPEPLGEVVPTHEVLSIPRRKTRDQADFPMRWIGSGQWALRNRMNVDVGVDSGTEVYGIAHTWKELIPPKELFTSEPTLFALVRGERKRSVTGHGNQLCTSNPRVPVVIGEKVSETHGK